MDKHILLHIKNVTKTYHTKNQTIRALKGVNLDIRQGEIKKWNTFGE